MIIPYTRSKYKKIIILIPKQVYNDQYYIYLRILVRVNSYKVRAIINLGVIKDFIVENTARAIELLR